MPKSEITPEQHREIRRLADQALSNTEIGRRLNIYRCTVAKYRTVEPPPAAPTLTESSEQTEDGWKINLDKTRIHTLADLIKHFNIDTDIWEVERFVANKWEMGYKDDEGKAHAKPLFQVKAFFKRNRDVDFAKQAIERLIERAKKFSPKYPKLNIPKSQTGNAAEYSVVDFHFGAHIWGKETGSADWDLEIAKRTWKRTFETLVARTASFKPETAIVVLGNDQQNSDNRGGTTEKGTQQDNDSRYHKVFDISLDAAVWAIDLLLAQGMNILIVVVPGNHDYVSSYHLGKSLEIWYRHNSDVKIDNSPNPKKYVEHGINMLLFTHGNSGKLEDYGATMAAEQPEMWGRTKWREAHTGDKHHRRMIEHKGATVRILPSLRPSCAWSAENHYVGSIRAAEAYVWNKDEGLVGTACYSVLRGRE